MHSWSLFNAYHSAYLGARGLMALLGTAVPRINTVTVAIDLFPEPTKKARRPTMAAPEFQEFVIVTSDGDPGQREIWDAFQRTLRQTEAKCWNATVRQNLLGLSFAEISRRRNRFLYTSHFWPLLDLIQDGTAPDFHKLFGTELDVDEQGFLLRLCFSIYYLFDQLMRDLSGYSSVIKKQLEGSRVFASAGVPAISCYSSFVSQVSSIGA